MCADKSALKANEAVPAATTAPTMALPQLMQSMLSNPALLSSLTNPSAISQLVQQFTQSSITPSTNNVNNTNNNNTTNNNTNTSNVESRKSGVGMHNSII
jgi:hypothetical protein